MTIGGVLFIILVLWLLGYGFHGRTSWGWGRNGDIGTILLVVLVLWLFFGSSFGAVRIGR